jgi:serine/threonine protein kinase
LDNILPEVIPSPPLTPVDEDNDLPEANLITNESLFDLTSIGDQSVLYDLTTIVDHPFEHDMNFTDFSQVHLMDQSYCCKVFKAHLNNEYDTVIVKMITLYALSLVEFDREIVILSKLQHTNIIQLIGTGHIPRRFMVLPYLSGGTLLHKLQVNRKPKSLIPLYFQYTPTFDMTTIVDHPFEHDMNFDTD